MKIISKRGQKKAVEATELDVDVIILDDLSYMTPEEIRRAEEVFRELRRQLEELNGG